NHICTTKTCCNNTTHECRSFYLWTSCDSDSTLLASGFVTCTPNPCPSVVCCRPQTGDCVIDGPQGCTGAGWFASQGNTCTTAICPVSACCDLQSGACFTTGLNASCTSSFNHLELRYGVTCSPLPCTTFVCCDPIDATCTLIGPMVTC